MKTCSSLRINVQDSKIKFGPFFLKVSDVVRSQGGPEKSGQNQVKQKDWVVGIDDPTATEERMIAITMRLKDRAMATSGNYRKFRIDSITGKKYVHSINPLTGYPKISNVLSVSVLAPTCAVADAYATTFMIMDLDATKALLQQQTELDVYVIYADVDGEMEVFSTQGFEDMML